MIRIILLSLLFVFVGTIAYGQATSLSGKLTDKDTGEPVMFANVAIYKNGVLVTGVETDLDGNYYFANIDSGKYDIESSFIGYATVKLTDVVVYSGESNTVDLTIAEGGGVNLDEVVVVGYEVPLIRKDETTQGKIVTADQIKNLPTRSINGLAATSAGVGSSDDGGDLSIRGARTDGTVYYIDGVQVRGNLIPESEIDQLQVITGGVDASYGDVVGGVISITTKGPSNNFGGGITVETSEPFDNYGYNLFRANVSGPILKKKFEDGSEKSIIGFRVSGQYRAQADDDPPALPVYVVKDDVREALEANPVESVLLGGQVAFQPTAQNLTNADVNALDFRPNEDNERYDLTAKIDARLTDNIDITLSGTFNNEEDLFTPGYGSSATASGRNNSAWGGTWTTFNSHNNPISTNQRIRGNFRFRHRLSSQANSLANGEDVQPSVIQNASYILQLGYERQELELGDSRHGDNLFNYGHVGAFDFNWVPAYGESDYSGAIPSPNGGNTAHIDYQRLFTGYTPGDTNPVLANYNNSVADAVTENDYFAINGDFNGTVRNIWNFHDNVGAVYNFYRKRNREFLTLNVNSNFDIVPDGKSDKGRHSIQFGIRYEQRFERGFDISPRALWTTARQQSNRHLTSIDTTMVPIRTVLDTTGMETGVPGAELDIFSPINNQDELAGNYFYDRARMIDGTAVNEFFNVDAIDPSLLNLGLFSAQELNDQTLLNLNYYGFNYKGERISNTVTFDDFFLSRDENGVRDLPVAAFQPIYAAAYLQDKFKFKDVIFRVGLRVERYDANTKVLKDPFSLYTAMSADQFYSENPDLTRPETVEDDFKVYVSGDAERSSAVTAFRDGETWYFADGEQANGGNVVFGGQVVTPRLTDQVNDIRSDDFEVSNSFTDYEPELNWMPRLAFSFPISDDANFFAHYDILVQRPSATQALTTPLQYYYFLERGQSALLENPNLRPQKKIDYEVGFQQKLNRISAIKISAFYNELRDLIQRRTYSFVADIGAYTSFDNQDFGTVKGFTFAYDLRRTNNIQVNATYTLQFADGTGSDADSQAGLTTRGNLRTLFPFNYDERHRINLTLDYRYGSGKKYNGPKIRGKDILANAGININGTAVSGRPYTQRVEAEVLSGQGLIGALNGARLPWNYWLNLKIDKQFSLTKPDAKTQLGLNVFFRIQNVLDRQNIINVYSASGSPEDDGFLVTNQGQDQIRQITSSGANVQSFLDAYQWRRINPTFYSLPRRMYIGAALNF